MSRDPQWRAGVSLPSTPYPSRWNIPGKGRSSKGLCSRRFHFLIFRKEDVGFGSIITCKSTPTPSFKIMRQCGFNADKPALKLDYDTLIGIAIRKQHEASSFKTLQVFKMNKTDLNVQFYS